jgi:hypothetical protein
LKRHDVDIACAPSIPAIHPRDGGARGRSRRSCGLLGRQHDGRPYAYPAVHDMPPPRGSTVLTDAEQKKLEDDLIAARNRTASEAKPVGRPD